MLNLVHTNLKRGRALIIVAHPDDETIWIGGTILAHPMVEWTIYALCGKNNPERARRFRRAAKIFNARGIISDLKDNDDRLSAKELSRRAEKFIIRGLSRKSFDHIFTHGEDGEYGNKRHQGVYMAVSNLLKNKKLSAESGSAFGGQARNVFCFAYEMHKGGRFASPKKKADFELKLSKPTFNKKLKIIRDVYGFTPNSFEFKSCAKVETFNILTL